jgi:hypothetical protein
MNIYTPYFYIIQEVTTGMYYAGAKWGRDADPGKFMTEGGYITSSNIVNHLIEQNGLNSFILRKIRTFATKHDACYYETRFLQKVNAARNKMFFNGHNNNSIFDTDKMKFLVEILHGEGITNISQTEYWKEIMREKREEITKAQRKTIEENWDDEFRENLKKKKQESWEKSPKRKLHSERTKERRLKEEAEKSDDERKQFSDLMKKAYWGRSEDKINEHRKANALAVKKSYENNPKLRKIRSETFKGRITVTKDGKNKMLKPDEVDDYITKGWIRGSNQKGKKGKNPSCIGKKAVNKDGIAKYILKNEIEKYLENGWKLGLK